MATTVSVIKEHNLASPKVLNSQQTTTCPNGLPPDATGNCPTTNTNQLGGSASNNNNNNNSPMPGHH